jgi:hypothetical protein
MHPRTVLAARTQNGEDTSGVCRSPTRVSRFFIGAFAGWLIGGVLPESGLTGAVRAEIVLGVLQDVRVITRVFGERVSITRA